MRGSDGSVDQQRLGGAANAGTAHLGVDGDRNRHVEFGRAVDIEVADAFKMRENRHARLLLHSGHEALAPARDDHVEIAGKTGEHLADRRAVGYGHELDRILGQAGDRQALDEASVDRGGRIQRIRAAAQDDRIASLQAERAGVGRDVRPTLVDHADDAERRAHTLDVKAVRPVPLGDDLPDRVLQRRDLAYAFGHGFDTCRIELQPVHHGRRQTGLLAVRHIDRIGVEDRLFVALDGVSHGDQRRVLLNRTGDGERAGSRARLAADFGH
jgi:hypothetical protein